MWLSVGELLGRQFQSLAYFLWATVMESRKHGLPETMPIKAWVWGKLVNMDRNLNPPELGVVVGPFTVKGGSCLMQVPFCALPSGSPIILSDRCWTRLGIDVASLPLTWQMKQ